jgi:hypothetical protein
MCAATPQRTVTGTMFTSSEITRQAVLAHTDDLMRAAARQRTPNETPRAARRPVLRSLTRRLRSA